MPTEARSGERSEPTTTVSPISSEDGVGPELGAALSRDDAFDLLSNRRRRWTLHVLKQESGDATDLDALSKQVAAWENGTVPGEVTSTERRRVYTSLQQFHLPKLRENGIVADEDRHGGVALTSGADDLDVYLDIVAGRELPWSLYYAGLSALGLVCVLAAWIGVSPMAGLPDLAWGVAIAAAFAVSAFAHAYQDRRTRLGTDGPPAELRE